MSRVAVSRRVLIESMCCNEQLDWYKLGHTPPFAAQFLPGTQKVAIGDEEGFCMLVDTTPHASGAVAQSIHFSCHTNAIFDLQWVPGQQQLLTASGDQTVRLFDVSRQVALRCFRGHRASVKSLSTLDASTFASGGRDGTVCLWDDRLPEPRPTLIVPNAHDAPMAGKRKRAAALPVASTVQSVSCVCALHDAAPKLATAGASDGAIKLWDLRTLSGDTGSSARASSKARAPAPFQVLRPPVEDHGRPRGITSLAVDATGSRLLATTTSSIIYLYDTRWCVARRASHGQSAASVRGRNDGGDDGGASEAVAQFGGHRVNSFYVKSCFSPDGRHILSGSSDGGVYVWDADRPSAPPVVLWGHTNEVTAVAWCPTDYTTVVSGSDDATLRVWRVDREDGRAAQRLAALRYSPMAPSLNAAPQASALVRNGEGEAAAEPDVYRRGTSVPSEASHAPAAHGHQAASPALTSQADAMRAPPVSSTAATLRSWLIPRASSAGEQAAGTLADADQAS